ncbi:MAG: hypothetical protein GF383_16000, partial [Candidatus Lokiarchaeota archaeon]|nr:hypothetical protein [Candidatus Lokiarchaeota archaeon]MBD3343218.1 hypothetical protein [Candidatus Lokiarchaeota archaeon]
MNKRMTATVREYQINDYITLKLEDNRTNIYVKDRMFRQCMYLLLNIPLRKVSEYDSINSIDEAAEKLDNSMERDFTHRAQVKPEEEFIGHCSNIQAWAENGYDTRILHRNLAFPLLKKLFDVGDPEAKKVFKEEIALRLESGYPSVVEYLIINGYLKYLSSEELECVLDDVQIPLFDTNSSHINRLLEHSNEPIFEKRLARMIKRWSRQFGMQHISTIILRASKILSEEQKKIFINKGYDLFRSKRNFPLIQFSNSFYEYLDDINRDFILYEKKVIGIQNEHSLFLKNKGISDLSKIEGWMRYTDHLQELDLSNNLVKNVKEIKNFSQLKFLNLNNNQIKEIGSLKALDNLERLYLRNNNISNISDLKGLQKLRIIDLSGNKNITEIPDVLNNLPALSSVKFWNCSIKEYSNTTEKFFWLDQNYRFYKNFTPEDMVYYEETHKNKASSDNKLYKHFVKWVIKMRNIMENYRFNYEDIRIFAERDSKNAVWGGKPTKDFLKWI